jgi:hypothetical protein
MRRKQWQQPRGARAGMRLAAGLAAALACAGCAHSWIDADGRRHVTGLVDVTLPADTPAHGARSIEARTLGVLLTRADIGTAFSIGWSASTLTVVPPDSCVNLGPPGWAQSFTSRSAP